MLAAWCFLHRILHKRKKGRKGTKFHETRILHAPFLKFLKQLFTPFVIY